MICEKENGTLSFLSDEAGVSVVSQEGPSLHHFKNFENENQGNDKVKL